MGDVIDIPVDAAKSIIGGVVTSGESMAKGLGNMAKDPDFWKAALIATAAVGGGMALSAAAAPAAGVAGTAGATGAAGAGSTATAGVFAEKMAAIGYPMTEAQAAATMQGVSVASSTGAAAGSAGWMSTASEFLSSSGGQALVSGGLNFLGQMQNANAIRDANKWQRDMYAQQMEFSQQNQTFQDQMDIWSSKVNADLARSKMDVTRYGIDQQAAGNAMQLAAMYGAPGQMISYPSVAPASVTDTAGAAPTAPNYGGQ